MATRGEEGSGPGRDGSGATVAEYAVLTELWYDKDDWLEHEKANPLGDGGASPRPWRVNPARHSRETGFGVTPPPILDANDRAVLSTSEWLTISDENVELIVRAVNALPADD